MTKESGIPPEDRNGRENIIEACAEEATKIVSQAPEIFASISKNFQASLRKGEALRKKNNNGARRTDGDSFLLFSKN